MIEFRGVFSEKTKKIFLQKIRRLNVVAVIVGFLLLVPGLTAISLSINHLEFIVVYLICMVLSALLCCIPQSKKEIDMLVPKRIYVQEDTIVCVTNRTTESRLLRDVKFVRDHGEFYELVFHFGKISANFICQKDLLTRGSLKQFENLFDCKIERINK